MAIDIRTLILILGLSHLIQVIVFSYQYRINKTYPGPGWWLLWCLAEVVGFTCLLLRNYTMILPYVIMVQNISIVGGTIFIFSGYTIRQVPSELKRKRAQVWV